MLVNSDKLDNIILELQKEAKNVIVCLKDVKILLRTGNGKFLSTGFHSAEVWSTSAFSALDLAAVMGIDGADLVVEA